MAQASVKAHTLSRKALKLTALLLTGGGPVETPTSLVLMVVCPVFSFPVPEVAHGFLPPPVYIWLPDQRHIAHTTPLHDP